MGREGPGQDEEIAGEHGQEGHARRRQGGEQPERGEERCLPGKATELGDVHAPRPLLDQGGEEHEHPDHQTTGQQQEHDPGDRDGGVAGDAKQHQPHEDRAHVPDEAPQVVGAQRRQAPPDHGDHRQHGEEQREAARRPGEESDRDVDEGVGPQAGQHRGEDRREHSRAVLLEVEQRPVQGHHGHRQQRGRGDEPEGDGLTVARQGHRSGAHVEGMRTGLEGDQHRGEQEETCGNQAGGRVAGRHPRPVAVPEGPGQHVNGGDREGPEEEEEDPVIGGEDAEGGRFKGEQADGQEFDVTLVAPGGERGAEEDDGDDEDHREGHPVHIEMVGGGDREGGEPVVLLEEVAARDAAGPCCRLGHLGLHGPNREEERGARTRGAE